MSNEQNNAAPVEFGCHCDLEPGMHPDGCVLDEGKPENCVHARRFSSKEQCAYWKPITPPAAAPAPAVPQGEPFGYFRAEPMGWTDCAATDEGAIALYERPAVPDVDSLAQFIRQIDGGHTMGTAALAERICEWLNDRKATEHAAPAVPQGEPWPLPWLQPLGELVSAAKNRDASREDQENAISSAHSKLFKILRATPAAPSQPAVPEIDYPELIRAAYATDKKWAQGTNGCSAFARGAEWFRDQVIATLREKGVK